MATRRMVTAADRAEISTGVKAGWTITKIAAHVGRDKSVISRELARNSTKTRGYRMVHADCRAQRSRARPQVGKIAGDPLLEARVRADLKQGRSPRAIAGRLRAEHDDRGLPAPTGSPSGHGYLVSHEAVYAYIYAPVSYTHLDVYKRQVLIIWFVMFGKVGPEGGSLADKS